MTAAGSQRLVKKLQKITARVFCRPPDQHSAAAAASGGDCGGNPVTIFASTNNSSSDSFEFPTKIQQQQLAKTCAWESVMVDAQRKQLSFYMPTGEEVSFCAHAAMGGALFLERERSSSAAAGSTIINAQFTAPFDGSSIYADKVYHVSTKENVVSLKMKARWEESEVEQSRLHDILRDMVGLERQDVSTDGDNNNDNLPTFCNSSIARPKTLIHIPDINELNNKALAPSIENDNFKNACDEIDSSGLYLYSSRNVNGKNEWECRQFPRASGYPEDPATGIAAAALAVSLEHHHQQQQQQQLHNLGSGEIYNIYQGTAMGRPSLITVDQIQFDNDDGFSKKTNATNKSVSFRLVGRVQGDTQEIIELEV
jgi:PhzF family phenazine biosynthesis protein